MSPYTRRPQLPDFLEMERRMPRVRFEEFVILVRKVTDVGW